MVKLGQKMVNFEDFLQKKESFSQFFFQVKMKIKKIKNNCQKQDSNSQPDASLQKVYLHPNISSLTISSACQYLG